VFVIKARILEIVEVRCAQILPPPPAHTVCPKLYMKLYPEQLSKTSAVEAFVQAVWILLKTTGVDDTVRHLSVLWVKKVDSLSQLVSPSLRFISTAIRSGHYKALFSSQDTIVNLVQGVVIPNAEMRGTSCCRYSRFLNATCIPQSTK
jgi:hypothetical protein